MKIIFLFLILIGLFDCSIIRLKYHKCTDRLKDSGLVALELDKFSTGEDIYITVSAYNGDTLHYLDYSFEEDFPYTENMYLSGYKDPYSTGTTSHKHNVSNGHGGYTIYYTYDHDYFYEFKKPENSTYLVMKYAKGSASYVEINNTSLGRYLTIIIIVSVVAGVILIGVGVFFFIKCRDRIECPPPCLSCSCCECECPWKRTYSYNITSSSYNTTAEKKENLLNITSDTSSANAVNTELKQFENKTPVPEPKEEYAGEKPYYLNEEEQPPNEKTDVNIIQPTEPPADPNPNDINYTNPTYYQSNQPMNTYDQQGVGYNQYPPQNNFGYNDGNYAGGGGIYQ